MTTAQVLNRDNGEGIELTDPEVMSYIANANPKGIMLNWEDHTAPRTLVGGLLQSIVHQGGEVVEIQSAIATAENWDETSPLFLAMGVLAWNLTPTDMATIADWLDERFVVVRDDQYFNLLRAAGDRATPQATPVS
jgi:hypothetical protein